MASAQESKSRARIHVENIGGIAQADVELSRGVNILTGRNATNRTSFLRAIMAALGSDDISLKGDADRGVAELTIDGETYTRRLVRDGEHVSASGDPYLEDPCVADLFAFLLESNEARRSVVRGDDLREIIMRPVDTEAIRREIERLETERRDIETALDERTALVNRLSELKETRQDLRDRVDETRAKLDEKQTHIEAADADLEKTRQEKEELDDKLETLQQRRSELERVRFRIETEHETIDELTEESAAVEGELADLPSDPKEETRELDELIASLREEKRSLDARINQLQGIIQFNQGMLADDDAEWARPLESDRDGSIEELTNQLLSETGKLVCWTCGTETDRESIAETLDQLRGHHRELIDDRQSLTAELEEATGRQGEIREKRQRRRTLETEYRRIREEIDEAEAALSRLTDEREALIAEIETLEDEVEELRDEDVSAIIDLHKEANKLEFRLNQLQTDLERTESDISSTEARLSDLDRQEDRLARIESDIEVERTRIGRLEEEAIEAFNDHMDEVLSFLEYDNIERIWLERKVHDARENEFSLHVVRTNETGAAYEDTIDHLSESEREVTGLVFALAGYLSHDVHETVPFMLLDSLEAIDSGRIAKLVEYFGEHSPFLVGALLPEDAEAIDDRHHRVTSI